MTERTNCKTYNQRNNYRPMSKKSSLWVYNMTFNNALIVRLNLSWCRKDIASSYSWKINKRPINVNKCKDWYRYSLKRVFIKILVSLLIQVCPLFWGFWRFCTVYMFLKFWKLCICFLYFDLTWDCNKRIISVQQENSDHLPCTTDHRRYIRKQTNHKQK